MAEPTQIRHMDAKQIAELHIVERYLANQLTDEEAEAFEAYVEAHPDVTRQIEIAARMKSGLATLQQRGELKSIVGAERVRAWIRPALIAASLVGVFAVGMLLGRQRSAASHMHLLAASPQEFSTPAAPLRFAARVLVTRTRGESPPTLPAPPAGSIVELRLDLHSPSTATQYSIEMLRVAGNALESVGTLAGTTAQRDGTLSIFVRGSALTEGNYLVRVKANDVEATEFALRVAPGKL